MTYFLEIWQARYFWAHLALADLRARWRRSFFGVLWSIMQPLGLTILISIVFSRIFKTDIREYAPYILSGVIIWDFILSTAIGGSLSFVQADAYIKQCRHPLAIYTLRSALANLIILMLASIGLVVWTAIAIPNAVSWHWLAALLIFPLLILIVWPLATLFAYLGARFRDLPHVLGLAFQGVWFVSPVYFKTEVFRSGGLNKLIEFNPMYHLLEIVRAPLLRGELPTAENYIYCLGLAALTSSLAIIIGRTAEPKVIFYL